MALIFFLIGLGLDFSSITKIFKTRPNREKKNQLKLMLRTYRSILIGCLKSPDNLEPINFSIIYIWMCKMSPRLQLVTVKLIPSPLNHLPLIKNCTGKTYYVVPFDPCDYVHSPHVLFIKLRINNSQVIKWV